MAVRPIICFPDPILRKKTKRVPAGYAALKGLIRDMIETLHEARGAGLAAPQIGVSLRIVVIQLPEEEPIVLVNPEMVKRSGDREILEGCLSLPGYAGTVKRSLAVTVKGRDQKGKEVRIKADNLLAQVLEHELDHLNGVLYIDRLTDEKTLHKVEPVAESGDEKSGAGDEAKGK
ncbi:MAG: peptide deformylase [Chloroflexota bacterium]